jgi:hypothetical protein
MLKKSLKCLQSNGKGLFEKLICLASLHYSPFSIAMGDHRECLW